MPVPRIAIVGRPNVGKSSLLNMVKGEKVSIVDPTPGTTRDRVSVLVDLVPPDEGAGSTNKLTIELTDTGGYGVYVVEGGRFNDVGADLASLTKDIEHQIGEAVAAADLVLFVVDAQTGVTAQDLEIARMLRERVFGGAPGRGAKARKKTAKSHDGAATEDADSPARELRVIVVANKCDGPRWEPHALEAASLGFGPPIPVSAKNNYFRRDFSDALYEAVAALPGVLDDQAKGGGRAAREHGGTHIAIIGKRNAGKSSLVNALAGESRVIVSEIAGTTRDAVDVRFEMDGKEYTAIDTAGLRRKRSFADRIEWFAFDRAQRSIERSDVVMLLVDWTEPISQVDQQLAMLVQNSFKPLIIVVNKWDLAKGRPSSGGAGGGKPVTTGNYEKYLREEFKGLDFAPIAFISAAAGTNIHETVALAHELNEQACTRATTGQLNRILRQILETRGPSSKLGTFAKAYFIAQVATHPPTIVLVVNKPKLFTPNYQRFLLNRLREELPFPEVPIKLIIKERKRASVADLLSGEHQRRKAAAKADGETPAMEVFGEGVEGAGEQIDLEAELEQLPEDAESYFDPKP